MSDYENAYNEQAFIELVPKSSQLENPVYASALRDLETDLYVNLKPSPILDDTIIVSDGAYLLKPNFQTIGI